MVNILFPDAHHGAGRFTEYLPTPYLYMAQLWCGKYSSTMVRIWALICCFLHNMIFSSHTVFTTARSDATLCMALQRFWGWADGQCNLLCHHTGPRMILLATDRWNIFRTSWCMPGRTSSLSHERVWTSGTPKTPVVHHHHLPYYLIANFRSTPFSNIHSHMCVCVYRFLFAIFGPWIMTTPVMSLMCGMTKSTALQYMIDLFQKSWDISRFPPDWHILIKLAIWCNSVL